MSLGFDEGMDMDAENSGGATMQTYPVKVKDAMETTIDTKDGSKAEVIQFDFSIDGGLAFAKKYQFLKNRDGNYKKAVRAPFPGSDGREVPGTLMWEMKELIKAKLGDEEYEKRKEASGGITKKFFIGAEFDLDCKRIETKDGNTFYIPMFADEVQKDLDYRTNKKPAEEVAGETEKEKSEVYTDLPF